MGLDVYSGCLVRYYSRNWLTSVQQWGLENGLDVQIVRSNNSEPAPVEDIIAGVTQWRDWLLRELDEYITSPCDWNEDNDITPYYTDKPDFCAYEALQLFFAAKYLGEKVPETIPKDFNLSDHPLYQRFIKTKQNHYSLFECEWWLPISDCLMFPAKLPTGHDRTFATTGLLREELKEINAIEWKADKQTILSWRDTEGYPDDAYFRDGKIEKKKVHTEYNTESLAKFAFSIFWQAERHSRKHGTMIILDY